MGEKNHREKLKEALIPTNMIEGTGHEADGYKGFHFEVMYCLDRADLTYEEMRELMDEVRAEIREDTTYQWLYKNDKEALDGIQVYVLLDTGEKLKNLGDKQAEFLKYCRSLNIHILIGYWNRHYDCFDGGEYELSFVDYPGSADDAATDAYVSRDRVYDKPKETKPKENPKENPKKNPKDTKSKSKNKKAEVIVTGCNIADKALFEALHDTNLYQTFGSNTDGYNGEPRKFLNMFDLDLGEYTFEEMCKLMKEVRRRILKKWKNFYRDDLERIGGLPASVMIEKKEMLDSLGERKREFLDYCRGLNISILAGRWANFYDFDDGREYYLEFEDYAGSVDDAATYTYISMKEKEPEKASELAPAQVQNQEKDRDQKQHQEQNQDQEQNQNQDQQQEHLQELKSEQKPAKKLLLNRSKICKEEDGKIYVRNEKTHTWDYDIDITVRYYSEGNDYLEERISYDDDLEEILALRMNYDEWSPSAVETRFPPSPKVKAFLERAGHGLKNTDDGAEESDGQKEAEAVKTNDETLKQKTEESANRNKTTGTENAGEETAEDKGKAEDKKGFLNWLKGLFRN